MRTQIYESYAAFEAREDKAMNGVTSEFAAKHPGWSEERDNTGCWCCAGCRSCADCVNCVDCTGCRSCVACVKCELCSNSATLTSAWHTACMLGKDGYKILRDIAGNSTNDSEVCAP